ncbi:hypothetical protein IV38_GL001749 [Lactobacillus selangorensis]|uniref:Ribonuclease M5 n=1 Tax=Lactobacillus selangorensis TaxID=81857 RepID=A0A0R2FSL9_9LACO|nr:hypothetical protein IV38_GL001749 [Lactobacillus selangorensis]KRN30619.1 hypothetical protein IV40_GL001806 [Lactobacillus selangorensis]
MFPNVDTIETHGSAINDAVLEKIALAQEKRGVIVFTDPDFHGEKIRKIISQNVPGVKHAFLPRADAKPYKKGSLGVEHANPAAILRALDHLYTQTSETHQEVTQADLLDHDLLDGPDAKHRRERLGDILHIGYTNGKQLLKRLAMFQISRADFLAAVAELDKGEQ